MARLPQSGTDGGIWGDVLNSYLLAEHNADGTHKLTHMLRTPLSGGLVLVSDPASPQGFSWQDAGSLSSGAGGSSSGVQSQRADQDYLPKTGGTMSGPLVIQQQKVDGVGLAVDQTSTATATTTSRAVGAQFKQFTAGSYNFTDNTGTAGFESVASHQGTGTVQALSGGLVGARNTSSGTVANLTGLLVGGNQNLGAGMVINSYGLKVNAPQVAAGSLIHNYGLYIGSQQQGSGSNYALYTNAGLVRLGDTVVFDGGIITKRTTVSNADYAVAATDHIIAVTSLVSPCTITLPAGQTAGKTYVVKDESGQAAAHPITVVAPGSAIDGAPSQVIAANYGSLKVYYNGTNWFIIA